MSALPHPVIACMSSVEPLLTTLPRPPPQCKELNAPISVHNSIRRSCLTIARYAATVNAEQGAKVTRAVAIECLDWIKWYMPQLHHHHESEDAFWFPAWKKALIENGVPVADVDTKFNEWDQDHKTLDQHETDMMRDLIVWIQVKDDITTEQLQQIVTTSQQSLQAFATFVDAHLKSEEVYWIENFIIQDRITDTRCKELEKEFVKTKLSKMKARDMGYLLAFAMSPMGKKMEQQIIKGLLPFPIRWYYNLRARPHYMKHAPSIYKLAHGLA